MRTRTVFFSLGIIALFAACQAQINNARTVTVSVSGNCGMCEKTIEQAAFVKREASADWDERTQRATLTYDSTRTNADAILQRIAHAGYDNERYLAPDKTYAGLHGCCQYDRTLKKAGIPSEATTMATGHDHVGHKDAAQLPTATEADPLRPVFDAYFALKDALVASDAVQAMNLAGKLDGAMHAVDPQRLSAEQQAVWTDVMGSTMPVLHPLSTTKDLAEQRNGFAKLTPAMLRLAKAAPGDAPVYLDHCPMYNGGVDWLSRDKAIRNPYYGSQMMTCGSVKETIAK